MKTMTNKIDKIQMPDGQVLELGYPEFNNPYSLFDSKYSDHELNNLSWLKSEGQWNAKSVYPTAYDKLLKVQNGTETVEGLSVKLSTETYTDYDFVLNTTDETFRLPLKTKQKFYDDIAPVVGNGMTLGFTDGHNNGGLINENFGIGIKLDKYGTSVGQTWSATTNIGNYTIGLTTDPTKSGIQTHLTETTLYLYFYVGETVKNANLIDAGRIGEQLADKVNMLQASSAGIPSNKFIDLALGASGTQYTAPANGWVKVAGTNTSSNASFILITNNYIGYDNICWIYATAGNMAVCNIPILKGHVYTVAYFGINLTQHRFYYAEGSKEG